jgi:hypothetical protein
MSMIEPSYQEFRPSFPVAGPNRMRLVIPALILLVTIAAGAAAFWQFYRGGLFTQSAMSRQDGTQDNRDYAPVTANLQTNGDTFQQQQSSDQVQALQQDLAAQQAATRRLSDEVDALSSKLDALQQTVSSAPATVGRALVPKRKPAAPPPAAPFSIRP